MKHFLLFCILFNLTACGIEPVKTHTKPVKWDKEVDYYYTDEMYNHPEIIENIEYVLNDLPNDTGINFYECAEPGKYVVIFDYIKGENRSTIGKCENPLVIISSGRLDITFHELYHMVGMRHEHQLEFRDDFIQVDFDKVPDEVLDDFIIIPADNYLYNIYDYEYDHKSILHYSSKTWNADIRHIDGSIIPINKTPSIIDRKKLKSIYLLDK